MDGKLDQVSEQSRFCKNTELQEEVRLSLGAMGGSTTSTLRLNKTLLNTMLKSLEGKDNYLEGVLRANYWSYNPGGLFPQKDSCGYNPFKTADSVAKISALPCVSKIYISDSWVVKKVGHNEKVLYRPSMKDDRFQVMINNKCGEK